MARGKDERHNPRRKVGRMEEWFNLPREEMEKRTTQLAKGYLAHKSEAQDEIADPLFSHPEYNEQAELRAEQIKEAQRKDNG